MHRELTTGDLRAEIPDVPSATLYRQVAALARGVLDVADEKRVRGAVERTYPPCTGAARVDCDEAREMTAEELRQVFLTFVVGLPADFDHYLERGDVDMARDLAEGRQNAMNLTDEEMFDVVDELRAVLEPRIALPPAPGRTRRLLATVLVPDGNALASTNTATATTSVTPGRHLPEGARLMSMVQAGSVPAARHQVRATAGPWSSSSPSLTACLSRVGHDSRPTGCGGSTGPSLPSRSGSWLVSVAAIAVTAVFGGRAALHAFGARLVLWRLPVRWYFAAVVLPALLTAAALGIHLALGVQTTSTPSCACPRPCRCRGASWSVAC